MFVCLGNICRSPMAEAVIKDIIKKDNKEGDFLIESSGTGAWHIGEEADHRMKKTAMSHGITFTHSAQQLKEEHLMAFDYIFAMDQDNKKNIHYLDKNSNYSKKIHLFRDFDPLGKRMDVPDPYFGGDQGFEDVFAIVKRTCEVIYKKILSEEL